MSTDLLTLFRAEGIHVREIGDWRSRVRPGTFRPVGIVNHHTGSKGQGEQGLDILVSGRPDLNGPLCTASPRQDGTLDLISAGRANHAGAGSRAVYERVLRDEAPLGRAHALGLPDDFTGANGVYYGFEVDNSGLPGDDYPHEQLDTTIRANTALCRHHGWTANRCILHAEHTARKVDWSLAGDPLRAAVAHRLKYAQLIHGVWTIPAASSPSAPPHPIPAPQPAPQPATEVDMQALMKTATAPDVFITDGVTKRHVTSQAELQVLIAAGLVKGSVAQVAPEILAAIPTVHA